MKVSGVIAEYNPFHNGHKYQIEKIKENSDAVVCVMSGSFVQRGDVAIFDKWTRAKAALYGGADLIIELPVVFCASTAERFAHGAIELLSSIGIIDEVCFGSESGDILELTNAGRLLSQENELISNKVKTFLSNGYNYPTARQKAYDGIISKDILSNPNNILAVEYIRAIISQKSFVKPITIQRIGMGYHSLSVSDSYASATALREKIINNSEYNDLIPNEVAEIYNNSLQYSIKALSNVILYLIRSINIEDFALINDVTEGLEYRFKEAAMNTNTVDDLVHKVSTKRYTKTRINRILVSLLLGIDKQIIHQKIEYIRVLGFNDVGRKLINEIKKKSELPIIVKTADYKEKSDMFKKDLLSTDIAALCANSLDKKTGGKDFTTPPVYVKLK